MDKEPPYETYHFIETSTSNPDVNHLLVLQDDGTLLSVNKDIQYITQAQDVKEGLEEVEPCAVFDVTSQQFYVDVDNASSLMRLPDQFSIHDPDDNIYSNSFLIQTESSAASEPMETESNVPTLKPCEQHESVVTDSDKVANNFTEITLTDTQYQLLEQKGWLLLEIGERIFVLDTLGLHDITTDEKLIQKLKNELEGINQLMIESGDVKVENISSPAENNENEENALEMPVEPPNSNDQLGNVIEEGHIVEKQSSENKLKDQDILKDPAVKTDDLLDQQNDKIRKTCDSIKIKTKYTFSDIPNKILLGKTINGKKLYAKVTKSKHKEFMNLTMSRKSESCNNLDVIDDVMFIHIVQDYIREHPSKIKTSNVIAADSVVTQLMRMPHIKDTVMGNYVIVTKTVIFVTADGKEITRHKPITVTGEVKSLDQSHGRFVHTPDMLHKMACPVSTNMAESSVEMAQPFVEFVHIHLTETKVSGKPSVQAINVSNRKLSLDVLRDTKKRHPNPVYACGACAGVFKSQSKLKDHLENHCPGIADPAEDTLTIDTDQLQEQTDNYYILDTGFHKWYCCTQCEAKFSKLFNCKKHINQHSKPVKKNSGSDEITDSEIKEYKCQMCSSKYFHASSLSKHIVKRHIVLHPNTNKP